MAISPPACCDSGDALITAVTAIITTAMNTPYRPNPFDERFITTSNTLFMYIMYVKLLFRVRLCEITYNSLAILFWNKFIPKGDNEHHHYLLKLLANVSSSISKHTHPRRILLPFFWRPRISHRAEYPLRVRHHDGRTTIF